MAASWLRVAGAAVSTSNTTSVVVNITQGVTPGNLLIYAVGIDKTSGALGPTPAGWTLLSNQDGTQSSHVTYWKIADGTEGNVTVSWTTPAAAGVGALVHEFTGVDQSNPIGSSAVPAYSNTASTTYPISIPSAGVDGSLAVACIAVDTATVYPWDVSAPGWTNRGSAGSAGGKGVVSLLTYDTALTAGQFLGTQTFTSSESDQHSGVGFIINGATNAPPPSGGNAALRTSIAANDKQSTTSLTASFTIPASAAVGDVALVTLEDSNATSTMSTAPAGWTLLSGPDRGSAASTSWLYSRTLTAGDIGSTVTWTKNSGTRYIGEMVIVSGGTETGMVVAADIGGASGTTSSLPFVSAPANSLVVALVNRRRGGAVAAVVTIPAPYTTFGGANTVFGATPELTIASGYQAVTTAGTYGGETITTDLATVGTQYLVAVPSAVKPTVSGAVTMGANSGLGIPGTKNDIAAVVPKAAASAVILAGKVDISGVLSKAVASSLVDTGLVARNAVLPVSGTSTAALAGLRTASAVLPVSASSTLLPTSLITRLGVWPVSASGALTLGALRTQLAALSMSSAASASVAAVREQMATLGVSAGGALSLAPSVSGSTSWVSVAPSSFIIAGSKAISAVLAAQSVPALVVSGRRDLSAVLAATGSSAVTIGGFRSLFGVLPMSSGSSLVLSPISGQLASWAATSSSSLTLAGLSNLGAVLAVRATPALTLTGIRSQLGVVAVLAVPALKLFPQMSGVLAVTAAPRLIVSPAAISNLATLLVRAVPSAVFDGFVVVDYHPNHRVSAVLLDNGLRGIVLLSGTNGPQNAFADGSFEGNWPTIGKWAQDSTIARTGRKSMRSDANSAGGTSSYPFASIPVRPGQVLRLSAWRLTTADYNGTQNNGKLRLGNQAGALISAIDWGNGQTWTERVINYTVPLDGSVTKLNISLVSDHTVGTVWVDDLVVQLPSESSSGGQLLYLSNGVNVVPLDNGSRMAQLIGGTAGAVIIPSGSLAVVQD